MTPFEFYQQQIEAGIVQPDIQQEKMINQLQLLYEKLVSPSLLFSLFKRNKPIKGLYLWGDVGVGKTFLMDTFYRYLPIKKMRTHFLPFMQMVHEQLKKYKGKKNPLKYVAQSISVKAKVLCFDEFAVNDIADAMLLAGLLKELFSKKICLVATSNLKPDDLYLNGLQREQFLPAIGLINEYTHVFQLCAEQDYRLTGERIKKRYWVPSDHFAKAQLKQLFLDYLKNAKYTNEPILICNRYINVKLRSDNIIWFDFLSICSIPRSQQDYLELVKKFKTIFISDIPIIKLEQKDLIRAMIHLIDVLYDTHVRLIIAAEAFPQQLYPSGPFVKEFNRTCSRLIEMQSNKWLID